MADTKSSTEGKKEKTSHSTTTGETKNDAHGQASRLYRSESSKVVAGVAGGLGEFFNIDPTIIRILFILLTVFGGSGLVIYIVLWLVIPLKSDSSKNSQDAIKANIEDMKEKTQTFAHSISKPGIDETKKLLEDNGVLVTGLDGPVYKTVKGIKFAFLGYSDIEKTPLVSIADENKIKAEVSEAKKNADVVVVQYHWGTEYITPPEERQRFLGQLTIDAGADLVIGNHPHWIKPIEFYKDKLITYAHGNFVFDQEWSQKTKEGMVGIYTFDSKNLVDVKYLPVEIVNFGQPHFLEGAAKQKILDEVYNESLKLK